MSAAVGVSGEIVVTTAKTFLYLSRSYILTSGYAIQKPPPVRGPTNLIDIFHSLSPKVLKKVMEELSTDES